MIIKDQFIFFYTLVSITLLILGIFEIISIWIFYIIVIEGLITVAIIPSTEEILESSHKSSGEKNGN